jgi:hypothetical protein
MVRMRAEFSGHFGRHGRNSQTIKPSSCMLTSFKKIKKPAACEMWSVSRFLNARNMKPPDIHRQFCEVHGEHAMSDSMIRRWVRHFNKGPVNEHEDPRSGRPSVSDEVLVRAAEDKIQDNKRLTVSSLSIHFP